MPIAISVQAALERSSWIRRMFEEGATLRRIHGDENVFDFTLGNPDIEPPAALRSALRKLVDQPEPGMHRYMNNAGYEETRSAVAARLSRTSPVPVDSGHVVMTCGAGGAINVVLKTILNPGEEVLLLAPYFVEYNFYVGNHGGTTKVVWTDRDTFQPDLKAIEQAIGHNTRAILINSPNNPTGAVYPAATLSAIGALLEQKSREFGRTIYAISDEPYARIVYDGATVPNIFGCIRNSIIVTSHSKDLALPGERIGYLAANPQLSQVQLFIDGAVFANRVLGFVNAPALAQRLVAGLQDESVDVELYRRKRDLLVEHLSALGFRMVRPQGAFYLFPESPLKDDVAFCRLAQKHNILVVPGTGFGAPGYFRIAYCTSEAVIRRSFAAWANLARDAGL